MGERDPSPLIGPSLFPGMRCVLTRAHERDCFLNELYFNLLFRLIGNEFNFLNKNQILSSVRRGKRNVAKRAENVLNRAEINFVRAICTNLGAGKHPERTPQTSLPRQFLNGRDRRAAASPAPSAAPGAEK